jgi:hypothetical protein
MITADQLDPKGNITMSVSSKVLQSESGFWAVPDHSGDDYYTVISRLHRYLRPKTYFEIGVRNGDTLALAECPSIAVDPNLEINQDVIGAKSACLLFQISSDAFFATYDPKALLPDRIDMALIDGLHLFEYVLRDFINLERSLKRNSVLLLDECIPIDAHICRRRFEDQKLAGQSSHADWWAGDVWKAVVAVRNSRPDLRIHAYNAVPNGLVAITNFDPGSDLLDDQYFDIVAQYRSMDLAEYGVDKYFGELNIQETGATATFEDVAELFWL